jgi:thioredoxin 2
MTTSTVRCERCGRSNRVPAAAEGRPRCGNCRAPLPWIAEAGDRDFTAVAEQATPFVLVDLWAPWCGPCRMVSPALEQLAHEKAGQLKLVKVNVDEATAVAQRFSIRAVPTLLLMRRGELVDRLAGAAPVDALRRWVDQTMARATAATSPSRPS